MEQNNISEQENDLQTNEKKDNKKTDEKESTAKTILEYVISIGIAIVAALLINNFILLNAKVPSIVRFSSFLSYGGSKAW